jgi:hypothetical protein
MFDHVPTARVGAGPVGPPSPPSAGHVGGTKGIAWVEIDPFDAEPVDAAPADAGLDEPLAPVELAPVAPVEFAPESFELPGDAPESGVERPSFEGEGVPESELEVGVRAGTAEDGSPPQPAIKETTIDARTAAFMMSRSLNGCIVRGRSLLHFDAVGRRDGRARSRPAARVRAHRVVRETSYHGADHDAIRIHHVDRRDRSRWCTRDVDVHSLSASNHGFASPQDTMSDRMCRAMHRVSSSRGSRMHSRCSDVSAGGV